MSTSQRVFKLAGKVQHYAWGGESFIPALLNISNQEGKPYAEYWMGAHDNTPAELLLNNGKKMPLNTFIEQQPAEILGEKTANRFGRLPFLFKVLDVKDMLSIQVHPTKREAEKGFERENLAGIPLSAPQRNYKDDNHKPEIMVALSDFWLLHGFKHQPEIEKTLNEFPAFHPLIPDFKKYGFKELYRKLMKLPQQEIDLLLAPLAEE
ncbi:MAG TPA: mannose-6-phosphate isomerase, class I, partial [Parasegetibacter sp.]